MHTGARENLSQPESVGAPLGFFAIKQPGAGPEVGIVVEIVSRCPSFTKCDPNYLCVKTVIFSGSGRAVAVVWAIRI